MSKTSMGFLKKGILYIVAAIIFLIVFLGIIVGVTGLQQHFLVPKAFELWITINPWYSGIYLIEVILISLIVRVCKRITGYKDLEIKKFNDKIISFLKKHIVVFSMIICTIFYLVFINIGWIKGDNIMIRSTFKPFGKQYTINDIVEIKTGFESTSIPLYKSKGTFYYKVKMKDGKTMDLNNMGSEGKGYVDDTYLVIEEIDKRIMKSNLKVTKISSYDYAKYAHLDNRYMERFKRIIENK